MLKLFLIFLQTLTEALEKQALAIRHCSELTNQPESTKRSRGSWQWLPRNKAGPSSKQSSDLWVPMGCKCCFWPTQMPGWLIHPGKATPMSASLSRIPAPIPGNNLALPEVKWWGAVTELVHVTCPWPLQIKGIIGKEGSSASKILGNNNVEGKKTQKKQINKPSRCNPLKGPYLLLWLML